MSISDLFDSIVSIVKTAKWVDILDILILSYVVYAVIRLVRETRAGQLMKGLLVFTGAFLVAKWLDMKAVTYLLTSAFDVGLLALVIMFQPELRRALEKAGMPQIPVISLNMGGIETNPGFELNAELLMRAAYGAVFGDIFMRCVYRMRPYEKEKGSVEAVHQKWLKKCQAFVSAKHMNFFTFRKMCRQIVEDFDAIPVTGEVKPRVGIVGEILVKFAPAANNHLVELLESEGAEAVVPDLLDFMLYCFYNQIYKAQELGTSKKTALISRLGIYALEFLRGSAAKALSRSKNFTPPTSIYQTVEYAKPIVSIGNQTGEGWFLTGEMVELIHSGVNNIVCTQPFACLPNHVVGKGVIKALRKQYPLSNIVAIDYDPGASEVNQLNRIKLMLSTAQKNLAKEK